MTLKESEQGERLQERKKRNRLRFYEMRF